MVLSYFHPQKFNLSVNISQSKKTEKKQNQKKRNKKTREYQKEKLQQLMERKILINVGFVLRIVRPKKMLRKKIFAV